MVGKERRSKKPEEEAERVGKKISKRNKKDDKGVEEMGNKLKNETERKRG